MRDKYGGLFTCLFLIQQLNKCSLSAFFFLFFFKRDDSCERGEWLLMEAYIDSNYEGSMSDRRSTAGYYIFLCEHLFVWRE